MQSISDREPAGRQEAVDHVKQWIDIAIQYGCQRVMINQQQAQLTKETREGAVAAMKAMADYGRPKNVKVSAETRGAGTPEIPAADRRREAVGVHDRRDQGRGRELELDIGNVGAMSQQELHDCIKGWFPTSSGNMHIKSSPYWDIGQAVKFTESLGYKGLYSIEVIAPRRHADRLQHDPGQPGVADCGERQPPPRAFTLLLKASLCREQRGAWTGDRGNRRRSQSQEVRRIRRKTIGFPPDLLALL